MPVSRKTEIMQKNAFGEQITYGQTYTVWILEDDFKGFMNPNN